MSRKIDALIATHVMGLNINHPHFKERTMTFKGWEDVIPHYSTEIKAAWEVVEKLKLEYFVNIYHDLKAKIYEVELSYLYDTDNKPIFKSGFSADTAPMAIAKAALKAKGIKYEG